MKAELQVSDIAMYLPYGLTFLNTQGEVKELDTISMDSVNIKGRTRTYGMYCDVSDIKPILRPLSDIDVRSLPSVEDPKNQSPAVIFIDKTIEMCYWKEYQYLIENLFDINDLIGQGLAVDINTIEK